MTKEELESRLYFYKAKIARIVDADTMHVIVDVGFRSSTSVQLRLARIDAWEMTGAEKEKGAAARLRVAQLAEKNGFSIYVKTMSTDSFGRWLAEVYFPDGTNISDLLLEEGHAIPYAR